MEPFPPITAPIDWSMPSLLQDVALLPARGRVRARIALPDGATLEVLQDGTWRSPGGTIGPMLQHMLDEFDRHPWVAERDIPALHAPHADHPWPWPVRYTALARRLGGRLVAVVRAAPERRPPGSIP